MSSAALMYWLLAAPMVIAVVSVFRTFSAIKAGRRAGAAGGPWSAALHLDGK